jgi:hypothetical protein
MQRYLRKEFWDYTRDAVQQGALPNQSAPAWFNQVAGQEGVGGALEGGGAEN